MLSALFHFSQALALCLGVLEFPRTQGKGIYAFLPLKSIPKNDLVLGCVKVNSCNN